jgi:dTDP-4-dehydrorhamnose reductase
VNCPVVYISTDYVFDGLKGKPYVESDITSPISAYGMSKLKGEEVTRAFNNKHFIVRTAGLYGHNGNNFVKAILRASKEKKELEVVNDQFANPTSTKELSRAILNLTKTQDYGIHHLAATGACSWYEFAREILLLAEDHTPIKPIPYFSLGKKANRPVYSVLGTEKPKDQDMLYWREGLRQFMAKVGYDFPN